MISEEHAQRLADDWVNADRPADQRAEVGLYEFDLGYVAWEVTPEPPDLTQPPDTIGGTSIVIDKQSGDISTWPNLPAPVVAEDYRRKRAGGTSA